MKAANTAFWKLPAASENETTERRTQMKHNKLTKLLTAALAALLLLTLASCGSTDVPDGMKSVSPESVSFNLYVPTAWADNSQSGMASAFYSSSDRSNVSMTCMVMDTDLYTLDQYAVYVDASLKETLPEYTLLVGSDAISSGAVDSAAISSSAAQNGEKTQLPAGFTACKMCGLDAIRFEYTAKVDGVTYHFRQIVNIKGNNFYIFTYTAEEENFDAHLEEVEAIVAEIKFK